MSSAQFDVPSGVPRGDHLSNLPFNIYINDLTNAVQHSQLSLFADDAKRVKAVTTNQDAICKLQRGIENLEKWFANNCFSPNIEKCKFMH